MNVTSCIPRCLRKCLARQFPSLREKSKKEDAQKEKASEAVNYAALEAQVVKRQSVIKPKTTQDQQVFYDEGDETKGTPFIAPVIQQIDTNEPAKTKVSSQPVSPSFEDFIGAASSDADEPEDGIYF